jgi:hypothetical protein
MKPLHYDDLPKNINECWLLLGSNNYRNAIKGFILHGEETKEPDLIKFKSDVLRLSGIAAFPKLFDGWSLERRISKSLQVIGREYIKVYWSSLVRYWLLTQHRPLICTILDEAGIPHKEGYIDSNYEAATPEMWKKGLAAIWNYEELPVRIYLGYVLLGTRKGKATKRWETLADALGRGVSKTGSLVGSSESVPATETSVVNIKEVEQLKTARAEDSGEFLLYEQEIIRALAMGAISRTDTVEAEDAVEMARQIIDAAPGRPHGFFLLGFAQSLHRLKLDLMGIVGVNQDRSNWHFAGYLNGLARHAGGKAIVDFLRESPQLSQEFLKKSSHLAFRQIRLTVAYALAETEEAKLFCDLAAAVRSKLDDLGKWSFITSGIALARELSSRKKYDEALMVTTVLKGIVDDLSQSELEPYVEIAMDMKKSLERREAIVALGRGDFEGARSKFGKLAAEGNAREKVEMRAWIALANANHNNFFDIFPSGSKEVFSKSGERMRSVVREISMQGMEAEKHSGMVNACAGMAEYSQGNYSKALMYFRKAAEEIMQEGRPLTSQAYLWIRFMRSASQLMNMDVSEAGVIVADFEAVSNSKIKPSSWFYSDLVESAALFPDHRVLTLVLTAIPDVDSEKYFSAYQNADVLAKDLQKRVAYTQWLPGSKRRKRDIFDQLCQVVRWDIEAGKTDAAELAIDALEQLAEESNDFAEDLLNLLSEQGIVPDIIDESTQIGLRIRILLRIKRETDALQLMFERFRKEATSSNAWQREQALELVAELKTMTDDLSQVSVVLAKLNHEFDSTDRSNDIILKAGKINIIYVGGNEIQQRYEEDLRAELEVEYPNLSIDFEYPGWSSNWTAVADGIKSRLGAYDGLVLGYFVRTIFGRTIRRMCTDSCPWWAAPGHGKASIKRGILAAARHAANRQAHAK